MNDPTPPERSTTSAAQGPSGGLAIGAILVIVGLLLLVAQLADIGFANIGWPLYIIVAGVVILLVGLLVMTESGVVVAGTIVTSVGLLLLYQDSTGHWESWAYAWALIGPAASGLGLVIWGMRTANARDIRNGTWGLLGGLAIFAVGFLFFEQIIGISGRSLPVPDWTLPAVVIGIGVIVLMRGVMQRGDVEQA
jgi:hypothetical protein